MSASVISNNRDTKVLDENGNPSIRVLLANQPIGVEFAVGGEVVNVYAETLSVAASATVDVVSYTVPAGKTLQLNNIEYSGTNRGEYIVDINNNVQSKQRTYYVEYNGLFTLGGLSLSEGDIIKVIVENKSTTMTGDFNANIQGNLRDA